MSFIKGESIHLFFMYRICSVESKKYQAGNINQDNWLCNSIQKILVKSNSSMFCNVWMSALLVPQCTEGIVLIRRCKDAPCPM